MKTVLIVDDEESISRLIAFNFEKAGFQVAVESNGKSAYERLLSCKEPVDLVVLDIMLPDMDGLEICRQLRRNDNNVPIILLSARDDEIDRVLGLEIGADDYVTKPFSPRELVARAKSMLRRAVLPIDDMKMRPSEPNIRILQHGEILMDLQSHEVKVKGCAIDLTPKEFDLLKYMLEHTGEALSRDKLSVHVWGFEDVAGARIVDVHMSHLREKIEPDVKKPVYIKTVRGIGYKLVDSVSR